MSEKHKIVTPTPEEVANYGRRDEADPPPDPAPAQGTVTAEPPQERSEAEEWKDKFLRAKADLANYRKRVEKERDETNRFAVGELALALLPILDDLDRVVANAESGASSQKLLEGLRLTRNNFLKALEQFHILPIEAHGQPFDPLQHEAMLELPSPEHAEPTVLEEVRRGYRIHERVLRPARVVVSKPPRAGEPGPVEGGEGG